MARILTLRRDLILPRRELATPRRRQRKPRPNWSLSVKFIVLTALLLASGAVRAEPYVALSMVGAAPEVALGGSGRRGQASCGRVMGASATLRRFGGIR